MPRPPQARLILLVALLGATSCDCADRARRLADRTRPPRVPLNDVDAGVIPPASSDPAEHEPNDTLSRASITPVTAELRPIRGALTTSADVDWYALEGPAAPGPWLVELTVSPLSAGLVVALELDSGGEPPVKLQYEPDGSAPVRVPLTALGERGPLRLAVRAVRGQGDYIIKLTRVLGQAAREAEPNDTRQQAWPLPVPGQIEGALDRPYDRDVFKLDGAADRLYTLRLDAKLTCEATVELSGEDGAILWAAIAAPDAPLELPNLMLPKGPLWLTVAGCEAPGLQRYTLHMTALSDPLTNVAERWEAEPNDEAARAQALGIGSRVGGWLHTAQDVDHFTLTMPAPPLRSTPPAPPTNPNTNPSAKVLPAHLLFASLKPERPGAALQLAWRGPTGEQLTLAGAPDQTLEVCGAPMAEGTLALEVRALKLPEGASSALKRDYTLTLGLSQPSGAGELEPNDAPAQADTLALDATREGIVNTPQDRDQWALTLDEDPANPTRRLRFSLAEHPANLAFTVFDDEGAPVGVADAAGPRGAEQLEVDLPAGRYIVEVRGSGLTSAICDPYKLTAAVITTP